MPVTPALDAVLREPADRGQALNLLGQEVNLGHVSSGYGSILATLQDVVQLGWARTAPHDDDKRAALLSAWRATPVAERATWADLRTKPNGLGRILGALQADAPVEWVAS